MNPTPKEIIQTLAGEYMLENQSITAVLWKAYHSGFEHAKEIAINSFNKKLLDQIMWGDEIKQEDDNEPEVG